MSKKNIKLTFVPVGYLLVLVMLCFLCVFHCRCGLENQY